MVRQRLRVRKSPAPVTVSPDELGVAERANGRGPILFAPAPQIAPGEPQEDRRATRLAALALQGDADIDGAIAAISQVLRRQPDGDDDEVARALLLRAELLGRTDRDAALADLVRARALSSPAARSVVDAAIPGRR